MIEVTKINGVKVLINPDLLELAEETPDTVLSFTTGRKLIVKESRQEIKNDSCAFSNRQCNYPYAEWDK